MPCTQASVAELKDLGEEYESTRKQIADIYRKAAMDSQVCLPIVALHIGCQWLRLHSHHCLVCSCCFQRKVTELIRDADRTKKDRKESPAEAEVRAFHRFKLSSRSRSLVIWQ